MVGKNWLVLIFVSVLALALPGASLAQSQQDIELANQYLKNGEFDKAILYFDRLYSQQPIDKFYENLLLCHVELGDFKSAEKLAKNHLKKNNNPAVYVDLGRIAEKQQDAKKAEKYYQQAIGALQSNQYQIVMLARQFQKYNMPQMALQTYERGKQLVDYPFGYEIAELYGEMGDKARMIDEYLNLLENNNSAYMSTVQNIMSRMVEFERPNEATELLRVQLLKRAQKNPDDVVFTEMLIWYFTQLKDFGSALIQTKALDKRLNSDGARVMNLARICSSNYNYDVAINAYNYVVEQGPANGFYATAKSELLEVYKKQLEANGVFDEAAVLKLEKEYEKAIEEIPNWLTKAKLSRDLAFIQANYLNKNEAAIALMQFTIDKTTSWPKDQALSKLLLADILVKTGEIWEASLLYGQVELDFKHDVLGQDAKFKNAKVYYYTGNFGWAKGQLDVLKGSTTKLIANDAMRLSLLISDNTGLDSTETALQLFAQADLLFEQNQFLTANQLLDSIKTAFPGHPLIDEILFKQYQINMRLHRTDSAKVCLEAVIKDFGFDILADEAMFRLAELNQFVLKDNEKAAQLYQEILVKHPDSLFVIEARKRFRALRGDAIN